MVMLSLVLGAIVFCIFSIVLVWRWIPVRYSLPILSFKFGIPLFYFHYSGQFFREYNKIAVDMYYKQTVQILSEGHTASSLLVDGFRPIKSIMNTTDPFYWWWNAVWIDIFGSSVFSPVLANTFVTVLASVVAARLLSELNYGYKFQQYFLVFSLLHWDILTWSSMMNVKDVLVMFFTITSMYLIITALKSSDNQRLLIRLSGLAVILWVLTYIRWYVPGLFLGAISLWLSIELIKSEYNPSLNQIILVISLILLGSLFILYEFDILSRIELGYVALGFFRYTIGPVPFGTAEDYTFLNPAAILHWIAFPVLIIGILRMFFERYERLLILYMIIAVGLYSVVPDAAGPRFRLQLGIIISLLQFSGLWFIFTHKYKIHIIRKENSNPIL